MTPTDDPIEVYLDELLVHLPGSPRQIRHTLAEVEGHLEDAAERAQRSGQDRALARATAVRELGPVDGVTDRIGTGALLSPARVRRSTLGVLLVGGVAGTALGVAAILAWLVDAAFGPRAIAAPFPAGSYTAADCQRWMANQPDAHGCVAAMTADHAADFLLAAAACGVLGVLALALRAVLQRRWASRTVAAAFPAGLEYLVGATLACLATVGLVALGVDALLVTYGTAAGQYFALAAAALGAAVLLGALAQRTVRRPLLAR